tara:strand:+ start:1311 stop:1454 length:144 start_codon:yes stop_codon:yes gene_type:complete
MALIRYLFEGMVCYLRALIALVGRVHGAPQHDGKAENEQADGSSVTY